MTDEQTKPMPENEADLRILSLANAHDRKFALACGEAGGDEFNAAFDRGIDNDWWTFVDLRTLAAFPDGGLFRVFKLTNQGEARLAELSGKVH